MVLNSSRSRSDDRGEKENHIKAMAILALDSIEMAIRARMVLVSEKAKKCLLQMEGISRKIMEEEFGNEL